jgi:hypothetical protein
LTCHQFQQRLFKIRAFCEMIGILPSEVAFSRGQSGFPGPVASRHTGMEAIAAVTPDMSGYFRGRCKI